jgi:hypothetical protein
MIVKEKRDFFTFIEITSWINDKIACIELLKATLIFLSES